MPEHTPTPWVRREKLPVDPLDRAQWYIYRAEESDDTNPFICTAATDADSEFIIRAVNAHDALLAALEELSKGMWEGTSPDDYSTPRVRGSQVRQARAALALAKGGEPEA